MSIKNYKEINFEDDIIVELGDEGIKNLCRYYGKDIDEVKKLLGGNLNLKKKELKTSVWGIIVLFGAISHLDGFDFKTDYYIKIPKD